MSTWQRHREPRFDRVSRSALGSAELARPQLTWRDMRPILLRSAAVVGIGAAMAAALANGAFLPELQPRPVEEAAVLTVQDEPEMPPSTAPLATEPSEAVAGPTPLPRAPAVATAPPAASPPPPAPAATTPLGSPPPGAAGEPALAYAPPLMAPPATAPPAIPATPSGGTAESAAEPATVGSLPPTECLGGASVAGGCPQTAALVPHDPAPQPGVDEAGSEQDELAAFVPRIPQARPEPPPRPRKTARKANWPADDPPNCGKKRARWRYVNDVPTWYCR